MLRTTLIAVLLVKGRTDDLYRPVLLLLIRDGRISVAVLFSVISESGVISASGIENDRFRFRRTVEQPFFPPVVSYVPRRHILYGYLPKMMVLTILREGAKETNKISILHKEL